MTKPIEPDSDADVQVIPAMPPDAEGQPHEAWVESVLNEGYRLLFGLDDPDHDSSPGRR